MWGHAHVVIGGKNGGAMRFEAVTLSAESRSVVLESMH